MGSDSKTRSPVTIEGNPSFLSTHPQAPLFLRFFVSRSAMSPSRKHFVPPPCEELWARRSQDVGYPEDFFPPPRIRDSAEGTTRAANLMPNIQAPQTEAEDYPRT